jgi:hypothetical protein
LPRKGRIERLPDETLNLSVQISLHLAPPGREFRDCNLSRGFTLGYFRILPPGGWKSDRVGLFASDAESPRFVHAIAAMQ